MPFYARGGSAVAADPTTTLDAVTNCPYCASDRVTTTNTTLSVSTYWRCDACGEIWNPGRARTEPPFSYRRW